MAEDKGSRRGEVQREISHEAVKREKKINTQLLGLLPVVSLVVGSQLGSGVFTLPASLAPMGMLGICSWPIAGLGALSLAFVFSFLSFWNPDAGGIYSYIEKSFGRRASMCIAWTYWSISCLSSLPLVGVIAGSLEPLTGPLDSLPLLVLQLGIIAVIFGINALGPAVAGRIEGYLFIPKIMILLGIPLFTFFSPTLPIPFNPTDADIFSSLSKAAFLTMWGFIGVETVTSLGRNIKNPARTLPMGMVFGTATSLLVYISISLAVMSLVSWQHLAQSAAPFPLAIQMLTESNQWGGLASFFIGFVCLSSVNSWILASSELMYYGAKEKLFPCFLTRRNRFKSPILALIFSCFLMVILAFGLTQQSLATQIGFVIELSVAAFLLIYGACGVSFLFQAYLRRRYTILPLGFLSLAFCLWMLWSAGLSIVMGALALPLAGFVAGFFIKKRPHLKLV